MMMGILHNLFFSQTEYDRFRGIVEKLSQDELYKDDAVWLQRMLGKDIKIPQRMKKEGVPL